MTVSTGLAVAMDWGGTWTRAAVIDRQGEILWQSRVANAPGADRDRLLADAEALVRQAMAWCGPRLLAGVGIALAGPVDAETGTILQPPNLRPLDGVSLRDLWAPLLGHRVWVGNDANLAALGEYYHGAGADQPDGQPSTLVYLTVSTGIGGGVVNGGKLFLGARGLAAEIGHMSIDLGDTAAPCQCGNRGCLEALASGTAIAEAARVKLAGGQPAGSLLSAFSTGPISSEMVFQAAAQGDTLALDIIEEVVRALSVGLANVLHLYNPDLVVLGGGVTMGLVELGLLPRIHALTSSRAMTRRHQDFQLVPAKLGDAAGLVGAARLVWQEEGMAG